MPKRDASSKPKFDISQQCFLCQKKKKSCRCKGKKDKAVFDMLGVPFPGERRSDKDRNRTQNKDKDKTKEKDKISKEKRETRDRTKSDSHAERHKRSARYIQNGMVIEQ